MILIIMKTVVVKLFLIIPILKIEIKQKPLKQKLNKKQKKIDRLQKEINSLNNQSNQNIVK